MLGFSRVTKGFDARRLCDRRRYEYILPAFAFDPACCRGEAPLAHVGAAGNIVEKHAGGELDLEAALKALPAADTNAGLDPQTGDGYRQQQPGMMNGSREGAEGGADALSSLDAAPSLSAQPASEPGIEGAPHPYMPAKECASSAAQPHTSSAPAGSAQPQGTGLDQSDQQHASSNGTAEPSADKSKQQPASAAAGMDQRSFRATYGRDQRRGWPASCEVPESYKSVRFTPEQQARLNKIVTGYQGTHNFHNYTVRVAADDPAAMRYILSFKCAGTMEIQVCSFCHPCLQLLYLSCASVDAWLWSSQVAPLCPPHACVLADACSRSPCSRGLCAAHAPRRELKSPSLEQDVCHIH